MAGTTLAAYMKYRAVYDSITRVPIPSTELGQRPQQYSTASENILVYGDDSRKGLDAHEQYILHTGSVQGDNTDTIMLIHLSPGRHEVTVLSIPRDTMVPQYQCNSGPGYAGQPAGPTSDVMINSLLTAGGPVCLWKTVEQQTGIFINHFIGIGMLGFVKVVNDLGGVNVCVPFKVNDQVSGLNLPAGRDHINGVQALAFWRTREDLGTGSDLERIQRDQFMSAQVVKGVLSSGLLSDPFRLLSVVTDAAASMTTDSGMTVSDLMGIANSLRHLSSKNVQFITAPNQAWPPNPARVQFAQPQAGEVFSAIAHDIKVPKLSRPRGSSGGAQLLTTSPSKVKVKVLNGSGVQGIAGHAAAALTSRGFDVTGTGNAASFAYTKSVIEYSSAADVAEVNTLKRVLTNVTDLRVASLTPGTVELIVGSDFTGLTAAARPSATSSASAPQSASASGSASQSSASGSASQSSASGSASQSSASASASQSASASASASQSASASASGGSGASSSPSASASGISSLAGSNGGITAAASCASDSSAFAGPLSP